MKDYRDKLNYIQEQLNTLKLELKDAEKQTIKFLSKCSEYEIKKVSIGKANNDWPFNGNGSVFTFNNSRTPNSKGESWPAIWGVVKELNISGGCGNTDQHQVSNENLMEGIYEFKNKKWKRID